MTRILGVPLLPSATAVVPDPRADVGLSLREVQPSLMLGRYS